MKYTKKSLFNFKGFTLLETLIAISVGIVLSTIVITNFLTFQKDAKLNSLYSELSSTLMTAKNKSVTTAIPQGYVLSDFDENGLPAWSVKIEADKYKLESDFTLADGTTGTFNEKTTLMSSSNLITPTSSILFERLTGTTGPICLTIKLPDYSKSLKLYVDGNGTVSSVCP